MLNRSKNSLNKIFELITVKTSLTQLLILYYIFFKKVNLKINLLKLKIY